MRYIVKWQILRIYIILQWQIPFGFLLRITIILLQDLSTQEN